MTSPEFEGVILQLVSQNRNRVRESRDAFEGIADECIQLQRKLAAIRSVQAKLSCVSLRSSGKPNLPQLPNAVDMQEMEMDQGAIGVELLGGAAKASTPDPMSATLQGRFEADSIRDDAARMKRFEVLASGGGFRCFPAEQAIAIGRPSHVAANIGAMAMTAPHSRISSSQKPRLAVGRPGPKQLLAPSPHAHTADNWLSLADHTEDDCLPAAPCAATTASSWVSVADPGDKQQTSPVNAHRLRSLGSIEVQSAAVSKHLERVGELLLLPRCAATASVADVLQLLHSRSNMTVTHSDLQDLFAEVAGLLEADGSVYKRYVQDNMTDVSASGPGHIPMPILVLVGSRREFREELENAMTRATAETLSKVLMATTLKDIVKSATKFAVSDASGSPDGAVTWETWLTAIGFAATVLSLGVVGTSMDFLQDHPMWPALQALCCLVFVSEIIIKVKYFGLTLYLTDNHKKWWNYADITVTIVSVVELVISLAANLHGDLGRFQNVMGLLRMIFIARVLRLATLFRSKLGKEIANILLCCSIGTWSLASVLGIFVTVLFLMGLLGRVFLGPAPGQDFLTGCGDPDDLPDWDSVECKVHYVYGEVYFNSVKTSMFTIFRFMMGDFSSVNDRNVVLAMSKGYGTGFDIFFVTCMVATYFGLFNIITAVFVESTIAGLKHSDAKRKQAQHYEKRFVTAKLERLVIAMADISKECAVMNGRTLGRKIGSIDSEQRFRFSTEKVKSEQFIVDHLKFDQATFIHMVNDPGITQLLRDLDIAIMNPSTIFETLDPRNTGEVNLNEAISGFMRLRGEPSKNDLVANLQAVIALHDKVDKIERALRVGVSTAGTM